MLSDLTEKYPYFGAAHFYLLKGKNTLDKDLAETAARTALFFGDPFLLNMQLNKYNEPLPAAESITATNSFTEEVPVQKVEETTAEKVGSAIPEELPLFEPLHATDYFASQGIKLSEEALGADKLGKQLKSFTAWLKTMKKIHPETPLISGGAETVVQVLAEKSNAGEEIVTEAMAEVYEQQGKRAKAAEIWSKLSLQNPSKSAYFAAKIESLNQ